MTSLRAPVTKRLIYQPAIAVLKISSQLLKQLSRMLTVAATFINRIRLRLAYVSRPDDIFIVTYPRSGTTWVQMILYQLVSQGDTDFSHISQVVPWLEIAFDQGKDLDRLPSPRIFKSHLPYHRMPKGPGRYIYVVRDGKDVAVSYYHFYVANMGFQGPFSAFFDRFMRGKVRYGTWFKHVAGWSANPNNLAILFLKYEDLIADLDGSVRKIAAFCNLEIPAERYPAILEQCSFAFMKQHEQKFDHFTEMNASQKPGTFIRKGQIADWRNYLDRRQEALFEQEVQRWYDRLPHTP